MGALRAAAIDNGRTIEDEALIKLAEPSIIEQIKIQLSSDNLVERMSSAIITFVRQYRIGVVISRLLATGDWRSLPPSSKTSGAVEKHARTQFTALKKIENNFEEIFGDGSIEKLMEEYNSEVTRLVHDASKGKYIVLSGNIQEVTLDPKSGRAMIVFTGEDTTKISHLPAPTK